VPINDTIGLPVRATGNGSSSDGRCEVYVGDNETERCTDWEYFGDIGNTIVSQVNDKPEQSYRHANPRRCHAVKSPLPRSHRLSK